MNPCSARNNARICVALRVELTLINDWQFRDAVRREIWLIPVIGGGQNPETRDLGFAHKRRNRGRYWRGAGGQDFFQRNIVEIGVLTDNVAGRCKVNMRRGRVRGEGER